MALAERFWSQFETQGGTTTYAVRVYEEGFGGSTTLWDSFGKGNIKIRNRRSRNNISQVISGTEAQVTFWITADDGTDFDALLVATERQFRVDIEKDTVLYFRGWIKPDNISKVLIGTRYEVTLSITDALSELKEYEFIDGSGDMYNDSQTEIEMLKNALTNTGIELDFKVQLGWYENVEMTSTECVLKEVSLETGRTIKSKEGVLEQANCHEIVTEILKKYNCIIRQQDGYYLISNRVEYNSFIFEYDWATLTEQSRTSHDASVDVNSYDFKSRGSISKIAPLRKVIVKQRNRYNGANLAPNGSFDSTVNNWTNNGFDTFTFDSGRAKVFENTDASSNYIESDNINLTQVGDNDYLKLTLKAQFSGTTHPYFQMAIVYPDLTEIRDTGALIRTANGEYENRVLWLVNQDNNYKIRLYLLSGSLPMTVWFDDINLVQVSQDSSNYSYDGLATITNTGLTSERSEEIEIQFGDGANTSELSAILIGGNLSTTWRTFGNTEDVSLVHLLGEDVLKYTSGFKNYLRVKIFDSADVLDHTTVLLFDSIYYRWVNYKKDLYKKTIDGELVEIMTASITTTETAEDLSTADGVDVVNATQTSSGVVPHNHDSIYGRLATTESVLDRWTWTGGVSKGILLNDGSDLSLGTGSDWRVFCDGTHLFFDSQISDSNDIRIRKVDNSVQFVFDMSAGSFHAVGEVEAKDTSDIRLKERIIDLDGRKALKAIMNWRTIRYWHKTHKKWSLGFIAQEVERDYPEVIGTDGDGFLMIHYGKLLPVFASAWKEFLKHPIKTLFRLWLS